jgi:hypothetical protein
MTQIYCLSCKKNTDTKGKEKFEMETKSGKRHQITGLCSVCGRKKASFVNNKWKYNNKSAETIKADREKKEVAKYNKTVKKLGKKAIKQKIE